MEKEITIKSIIDKALATRELGTATKCYLACVEIEGVDGKCAKAIKDKFKLS